MTTEAGDSMNSRPNITEGHYTSTGLTKREWFAGLAMQGLLAGDTEPTTLGGSTVGDVAKYLGIEPTEYKFNECLADLVAKSAVDYADALIEQLNKEKV